MLSLHRLQNIIQMNCTTPTQQLTTRMSTEISKGSYMYYRGHEVLQDMSGEVTGLLHLFTSMFIHLLHSSEQPKSCLLFASYSHVK
jgi:hypothetical protein